MITSPPLSVGALQVTEAVPDPIEVFVTAGAVGRLAGEIRTIVPIPFPAAVTTVTR